MTSPAASEGTGWGNVVGGTPCAETRRDGAHRVHASRTRRRAPLRRCGGRRCAVGWCRRRGGGARPNERASEAPSLARGGGDPEAARAQHTPPPTRAPSKLPLPWKIRTHRAPPLGPTNP
eukprot:scaffold3394_cov385-Prasinococcus_capsulatus_cf.AAC.8